MFTSPIGQLAFKSFSADIYFPVNMAVPLSESNIVYIPDFYFVYTNFGLSVTLQGLYFDFMQLDTGFVKVVELNSFTTIDRENRIIACDGTSVELGTGNWVISEVILLLRLTNTIIVSDFTFGLSGFSFSLTSSISFSDYLSKQTQDILTNDVVPAVETLNNTMNNVNSSVQDVNNSVQNVDEAVQQGNKKLTEISDTLNNMPQSVVDALDKKANEEADEFSNEVSDNAEAVQKEIEKVMPLMSFQDSLTMLSASFNNESRLDTLSLPQGKLPDFVGGKVLWEKQTTLFLKL